MVLDSDAYFLQCPECSQISEFIEGVSGPERTSEGEVCPFCHRAVAFQVGLPFACSWHFAFAKYEWGGAANPALSLGLMLVLTQAAMESMFHGLLRALATALESDLSVHEKATISELEAHFKRVTGTKLGDAMRDAGLEEYHISWRTLREARNDFIHDNEGYGRYMQRSDAWEVVDSLQVNGLSGMIALYNKLVGTQS